MDDYADRERDFNSTLGSVMGNWMSSLSQADIDRQSAWLVEVQKLFTPDKDGKVPTVDLSSKVDFAGSKADSSVGVTIPVGVALLGDQFAADTATLNMHMAVHSTSLDDTNEKGSAQGSGSASFGIGPWKVGVKISASMSVASEHKRQSDYRSTTDATLNMKRIPTPEPIQVALDLWSDIVRAQADIARAQMGAAANAAAKESGLIPGSGTTPPPKT